MYSRILIPLDGSKTAEQALPYGRCLADKLRIPVELLTVIDTAGFGAHASANRARLLSILREDQIGRGKSYLEFISGSFPGLHVKCTLNHGNAAEVIIDRAAEDKNTLIALATHGRSGLQRWLLGSIAEKVVRGSGNPVLLVRAKEKAENRGVVTLKTVIVPLDGSELAESVFPMVAEVAKKLDLKVVLFRAYDVPYARYATNESYYNIGLNSRELIAIARDGANEYLEKKAAAVTKLGVNKVRHISKEGMASDEIIALARETSDSLIAMCTHGRSGITRWAMGSVTENVVRHASAPVLIRRAS